MPAQRIAVMLFPRGSVGDSGVTISALTIPIRRFEILPRYPCAPAYRNYDRRDESGGTVWTTRRPEVFYVCQTMDWNIPCTDLQRTPDREGNRWRSIPTHCRSSAGNQRWNRSRHDYSHHST